MTTVAMGVASRDEVNARFVHAMAGEKQGACCSFETAADLRRTLTLKRWELLRVTAGSFFRLMPCMSFSAEGGLSGKPGGWVGRSDTHHSVAMGIGLRPPSIYVFSCKNC